ncbi:MFS transporter [Tengunoibacter tsumagoiensis]|uniref:MFS transporter n=1 Tax=Tengunoibacter tsumagoiensis TaxID=2014871 RepID=A0A402A1M9_9CHLR|nr:MFS transporter [Tengunoibacter tsumagoiensis]GCE12965.1 MFS transporter [Tengunoibacter tsumagoiensis]
MSRSITTTRAFTQPATSSTRILWACIIAGILFVLDSTLLSWIGPAIARDLHANPASVSILSSLFIVTLAAAILGAGALADRYGRKRLLLIGVTAETLLATLAVFTPTVGALVFIRALAGIAGAFVSPLTIAIIRVNLPEREHARSMGLYLGILNLSSGLSAIVIQLINQTFGWRSTFLLIILMGLLAWFMLSGIPESSATEQKPIDWRGIILAGIGLVGLIYGLNLAATPRGFSNLEADGFILLGFVTLGLLIWHESTCDHPVLSLAFLRLPAVQMGCLIALIVLFAQGCAIFQLTLYLQTYLERSPLQTALYLLPFAFASYLVCLFMDQLVRRFNRKVLLIGSLLIMLAGIAGLALTLGPDSTFWHFLLPLICIGGGVVIANTLRVQMIMDAASVELAGEASALSNIVADIGGALSIVLSTLLVSLFAAQAYTRHLLQLGVLRAHIDSSLTLLTKDLQPTFANLGDQYGISEFQAKAIVGIYEQAYLSSVVLVFWLSALALLVLLLLVAFLFYPHKHKKRASCKSSPL